MTDPYYADEHVTLYHGDALAVLASLPDGHVDAVVTDPPYSSGGAFRADRNQSAAVKYLHGGAESLDRLPDFYGDNRTERGLLLWSTLWLGQAWRVTRQGGAVAVFTDWRSYPVISDAIQVSGWSWRGDGIWIKPPGKSRPTPGGLWNDTEHILWGSKGARGGKPLPGSWQVAAPDSKHRLHVTEKPQAILRDLVRLAPEGGTVLDLFAGSGATLVAARAKGRRAIGCEMSADYCQIAADRLRAIDRHGSDVSTVGAASLFDDEAAS